MQMTNVGTSFGYSWCNYTTTFVLRVYGLPINSGLTLYVWSALFGGSMVLTYLFVTHKVRSERNKVVETKVMITGSQELSPELMMGGGNVGEPVWFDYEIPGLSGPNLASYATPPGAPAKK